MCYTNLNKKKGKKVTDEDNVIVDQSLFPLPEHDDNPFINRDLRYGILGFVYENKDQVIVVYTSLAAKTFCQMMRIKPIF